jgi:hypothetical protein
MGVVDSIAIPVMFYHGDNESVITSAWCTQRLCSLNFTCLTFKECGRRHAGYDLRIRHQCPHPAMIAPRMYPRIFLIFAHPLVIIHMIANYAAKSKTSTPIHSFFTRPVDTGLLSSHQGSCCMWPDYKHKDTISQQLIHRYIDISIIQASSTRMYP